MKVYLKITGVLLLFVFLQSCSPTQTISIKAKPGTIIYTPEMKRMAVIPDSGESEIVIPKDVTYDYLLSQEKTGDKLVPFALNFENRNTNRYKYLTEQQTNQDVVFTPLKQTADYKTVSGKKYYKPSYDFVEEKEIIEQKEVNVSYNNHDEKPVVKYNSDNTVPKNKTAQNVSLNHSQQVVGTYYGYGRLMSDNDLVERYDNLKIVVSKRTDNTVKVDIFIRNSIPYFSSPNIYNISKTYNEYTLHHTTNDSYITIDEKGNLNLTFKNIRNKGYVLKVTAEIE